MHSFEFEEIVSQYPCIKSNFLGVFSINTLPHNIPKNNFLIFNEDLAENKGTHWIALIRSKRHSLECFDSLGFSETKQNKFKAFIKYRDPIKSIKFNLTQFQPNSSINCGLFALYFSINRLLNLDLSFQKTLEDYFYSDLDLNESKVVNFFDK